jgi:predicted metal-dependent peptidase
MSKLPVKQDEKVSNLSTKELSEVEFRITAALNKLYDHSPFYYHFLRFLPKKFDHKFGYQAAVVMNKLTRRIHLAINPVRCKDYSVNDFVGLLQHESLHLCYEHLLDPKSKGKRSRAMNFNKACDYLINDHIPEVTHRYDRIRDNLAKARGEISQLFNGEFNSKLQGHPDDIEKFMEEMTREQYLKVKEPLEGIINKYKAIEPYTFWCTKPAVEHIPEIKGMNFHEGTSEELYNILFKDKDNKGGEGDGEKQKMKIKITKGEPGDDHSTMEEQGENQSEGEGEGEAIEFDELTNEELKRAIQDAANEALSQQKKFGNMPSNLSKQLFEMLKSKTNYMQIIQSFATSVRDSDKTRTWTRQHRKYPNQTPGRRREYKPTIVMGLDTSGSMWSDKIQTLMTAEIKALKEVCSSLWLVMGDTQEAARIDLTEKEFSVEKFQLKGGGGTHLQFIFDAAKELKADGIIVHTDGYFSTVDDFNIQTMLFIYPGGTEYHPEKYKNYKIEDCI